MTEKIKPINNPLTIIAIFAALAEISTTVAVGLIDKNLQNIFIWFIILFPTLLVSLFFLTLNYNNKVLYSPSDFREDKTYLDSLYGQDSEKPKSGTLTLENFNEKLLELEEKLVESVEKKIGQKSSKGISEEEIKQLVQKEIKTITVQVNNTEKSVSLEIPSLLKKEIIRWAVFPAFIPIIYSIVKDSCESITDLAEQENKYNFSKSWKKSALPKLLASEFLIGDKDKFEVNKDILKSLENWISINEEDILAIIGNFKSNDKNVIDASRVISQHFKI